MSDDSKPKYSGVESRITAFGVRRIMKPRDDEPKYPETADIKPWTPVESRILRRLGLGVMRLQEEQCLIKFSLVSLALLFVVLIVMSMLLG